MTRVVDGDTIELCSSPDCGFNQATTRTEALVAGKRVTLARSDENRDRYGRVLRYVHVGYIDVGLQLIESGLAVARYDSRDGYGSQPREDAYLAADKAAPNLRCHKSPP